jgi:hypothetical protein
MDNSKWNRPVSSTAITTYVSDYNKMNHINPFKLKVSRIPIGQPPKYFSTFPYEAELLPKK